MSKWQFNLSALFIGTFWAAVVLALALAMVRLLSHQGWWGEPWYLNRTSLNIQFFLILGIGLAVGGFVGSFNTQWNRGIRGPLIGLGIGMMANILFFICLALWASGL
jgi:hypothetical protein